MERPSGALATLLLLMATTACGATTAAMPGGSQPDAARERPPAVASWTTCLFPEEADRKGIDNATVVLWVHVEPDGSARTVQILHDPGNGFGRVAALCAMRARYAPGKDRSGAPRAMWTPPITVNFVRGRERP
ncbi:energy transducer TonB [Sorangium sp. So ce315]|uniref:energy transducer TonB n=1 Tax=Sorangium sp. So ce315 TaxID=3133299 RepID=UPI003F6213BC